jgi:DNA polymerase-1
MLDLMLKGVRIDHTRRKVVLDELLTEARAARDKLMAYNDGQPLFTLSTKRDKEVWAALQIGQEQLSPLGWLFSDPDYRATVIQGNLDRLPYTAAAIQRSLDTIAAKTVSREKLKDLVYNKYGLPIQFKKRDSGEETETLDIFTLQQFRLSKGTAAVVRPILDLAIEHTKKQKLATFIYDNKFDEDGRMRFSLKVTTEAGRLASSASPRGKKVNSQNIPREKRIRNLVLPEEGHVCVEYDYSQAEARICFVYTKDPELVELARKHPSEFDQHRYFAATIFGKPENEIDKVQRQVAKSCVHGKQRQLQGKRLSETLLKEGFVYSEEECEMMLQTYDKRFPGVRRWQEQVRRRLWKHRLLVNSWGRRWPVPYYELNDELLRRGLSFILQSDNADNLNILGFKSVHYWLKAYGLQSRIMLQEHDALVMSCPLEELYDVTVFVYKSMEQTRQYDDVELSIPVEMKLGCCWGDGVEYKKMPSRDQLETSAEGIISTAV